MATGPHSCDAGQVADAKLTSRAETLSIIETLTLDLLKAVTNGNDPILRLVRTH